MHKEPQGRRLLRELKRPRDLLRYRRFRTPLFVRLFLDHVEQVRFDNPREGLRLAMYGPKLAVLVDESRGPDGRREHRGNLVRAYVVLASSYGVVGYLGTATAEHARAQEIADAESIPPIIRADLIHGLAPIRARQKRFDEALDRVETAEAIFHAEDDQRRSVEMLAVRGYILNQAGRYVEALEWHGQALTLALRLERPKPTAPRGPGRPLATGDPADIAALRRVIESAHTNIADAVANSVTCRHEALSYIRTAYREIRGRRNCRIRHLLQWTEGKIRFQLSLIDPAERMLRRAREGFARLGAHWELAMVSLDFGIMLRAEERWADLQAIAGDTVDRFCELCFDAEAIAALVLWAEAIEARRGIRAAIVAAQETVADRKARP